MVNRIVEGILTKGFFPSIFSRCIHASTFIFPKPWWMFISKQILIMFYFILSAIMNMGNPITALLSHDVLVGNRTRARRSGIYQIKILTLVRSPIVHKQLNHEFTYLNFVWICFQQSPNAVRSLALSNRIHTRTGNSNSSNSGLLEPHRTKTLFFSLCVFRILSLFCVSFSSYVKIMPRGTIYSPSLMGL